MTDIHAKDLTKEAPRSAKEILGGYAILARAIDKGRATVAGINGEYNFSCPLDTTLFTFKGTDPEAFKAKLAEGATDEEMVAFFLETGEQKSDEEVTAWNDKVLKTDYHNHEDAGKKAWFDGEVARLGLDPETTYLFDYLDVDDAQSFA
jgi:hypothetical protein